jgi:Dyp-type peroxidase family
MLDAHHAANAQGLIVSPFAHLPSAVALLVNAGDAPGALWLRRLLQGEGALAITAATGKPTDASGAYVGCAAIAFTVTGLRLLGLDETIIGTFATPFVEGMHEPNRRHRLGDSLLDPQKRARKPLWGGNAPQPKGPRAVTCERTVHAAILLYHETAEKLADYAAPVRTRLADAGVKIVHELGLDLRFDPAKPDIAREHFGFADGISQPIPFGDGIVTEDGKPYPAHPVHGVAAGDIVLGLINTHAEPAPAPLVDATVPGADLLPQAPANAPGATANQRSLGLDGSYLVMRELSQDVKAFWKSMQEAAATIPAATPDWIAERVVGRTKDGVVLAKSPPPDQDGDIPDNDFLFFATDHEGLHCPLGSHIRRANPRDGLANDAANASTLLHAANNHRILRRGRKYESYKVPLAQDLPGLLFMCLNTDLARQFEFVQQTWLLNPSFATQFDERDPLLGPEGPFTIPADPLRQRPTIKTFIRFVGGEYFFLPSLAALRFLTALPAPEPSPATKTVADTPA